MHVIRTKWEEHMVYKTLLIQLKLLILKSCQTSPGGFNLILGRSRQEALGKSLDTRERAIK